MSKLSEIRRARDLAIRELAKQCEIKPARLVRIEVGYEQPTEAEKTALALALRISLDDLTAALPTDEEYIAIAVRAGKFADAVAALKADAQAKGFGRGHGGTGRIACPACGAGTIGYSVAASNGHMMARCSTVDCIAFME